MAARPPASCRCGCPHAALIPIYWNLAGPVRLPLPIIHGVNANDHLVGGFGLIELSFKVTDLFLPDMPSIENSNNEFVNAINVLFQIDHLPYRLTPMVYKYGDHNQSGWSVGNITEYPEAIIYEEELTHNEAVLPALHALMDPRFASANSEFREALNDYQDGRYGDCIRNCCNSLESTIKAIHKANNWSVVRWTRQPPIVKR